MSIAKIKLNHELNARMKAIADISYYLADQLAQQGWDCFADHMRKVPNITGAELISGAATLLADFIAYIILMMKFHVNQDVIGYTREELLKAVIEGACKAMEVETISMERINLMDEPKNKEFKMKP